MVWQARLLLVAVVALFTSLQPCAGLNVGINLAGNAYYGNVAYYSDVFMQIAGNSGPWDVNNNPGGPSLLDPTGAPLPTPLSGGGNSTSAWAGFTKYFPAGNYTLAWTGTGSFQFSVGQLYPTKSTTDGSGKQLNKAILWLPGMPANSSGTDNSWIRVVATLPVTDCHLYSPAEFIVPGSVFRADYLETLRPFSTFRFMDLLGTNGNQAQSWSQRTLSTAGSRVGTVQGIAYEDILDLAAITGKDMWINIPSHATDDFVCRIARFFALGELGPASNMDAACNPSAAKTGPFTSAPAMRPNQTLYLEFSNEVWNYGFSQVIDTLCMANNGNVSGKSCMFTTPISAIARAALANTSLPWTTPEENQYGRGQQLTFVLAKRCVDIFRAVFAVAGAVAPRLHTVLNVQAAYYDSYYYAYPFFENGIGPLNGTFNSFAIAPYLDIASDAAASSLDSIFSSLSVGLNTTIDQWVTNDLSFFNSKGVSTIAYEGGQGMSGSVNQENKVAAQFDPRMFTITQLYFEAWQRKVGPNALFNYFSYAGSAGQYGSWGALTSSAVRGSQKYDAILSLLLQPGDATLDGRVDEKDCLAIAAAYNPGAITATSDPATWTVWWRDGDFNHDGCVNAADLALLNAHVAADLHTPICMANGSVISVVPQPTTQPTIVASSSALNEPFTLLGAIVGLAVFV